MTPLVRGVGDSQLSVGLGAFARPLISADGNVGIWARELEKTSTTV